MVIRLVLLTDVFREKLQMAMKIFSFNINTLTLQSENTEDRIMVTFPNAKINIGLDILRKRPDGYHDISTVMVPVPWNDILEIVPGKTDNDTLTITGRNVNCPIEKNLVMKAVDALRADVDFPPVDIFLHKVIPDGAGLGGGSADAAFTFKALNQLFNLGIDKEALASMAAKIGADCPFFIYNRPMLCSGTGTDMRPIDVRLPSHLTLVIVKPCVSVSTRQAYSVLTPTVPSEELADLVTHLSVDQWQGKVKNDFEGPVFAAYPEIKNIKEQMMDAGGLYVSMSGSGSAVYGLFATDIMAENLADRFSGCAILVRQFNLNNG